MRYHYNPVDVLATGVKAAKEGTYEFDCRFYVQYNCDHPVYSRCTLYIDDPKGLAVIQQRFDPKTKSTYWGSLDVNIAFPIYFNKGFQDFFNKYAGERRPDGSYPTVTVRQIMWALRMKPLKKERWETTFDHKDI